mgnify:CR=1 FL=1
MRVLVAPLMAMAESAGPATRARALASAMASRGWKTTLCVPEGFRGTVPADVSPQPSARQALSECRGLSEGRCFRLLKSLA